MIAYVVTEYDAPWKIFFSKEATVNFLNEHTDLTETEISSLFDDDVEICDQEITTALLVTEVSQVEVSAEELFQIKRDIDKEITTALKEVK